MPTGGVDTTEESISSWIKAGVACVGIGSKLFPKETIDSGNYPEITEKVKRVVEWIQKARSGKAQIK
jgi:2-dehydro-3-deoxyphosphogluconate aldolase/(4S)-4-hydroxy-2-oxoglutarate aldolase